MEKHLQKILREMCRRVGADFNEMDFRRENWFLDYTWKEEDEENFKEWLESYFRSSKEAREEIMAIPSKNKNFIKEAVRMFILSYGWKTETE